MIVTVAFLHNLTKDLIIVGGQLGKIRVKRKTDLDFYEEWGKGLESITIALTVLVDILPKEEFLLLFRKLHDNNNAKLEAGLESLKKHR